MSYAVTLYLEGPLQTINRCSDYKQTVCWNSFQHSTNDASSYSISHHSSQLLPQFSLFLSVLCTGVSYDQTVQWMDSSDEEQKVWMAVMNNHNRWVESALPLRTDLQPYT